MAKVRVFFATNRNHLEDNKLQVFGKAFNPDGVAALRFGYADYESDPVKPKLQAVHVYPDVKGETDIAKTGGGMFMQALHQAMSNTKKTDTLVFIHGFNVSFMGALEAGALLGQSLKIKDPDETQERLVNVVVFSWPSDGSAVPLMSYYSDREDARVSGPAVARAFLKLRDFITEMPNTEYCQRRIHLLAHSMGNYVLRNGVQALIAKDRDSLVRLFDQIMLVAADEDDDTFEHDNKLRLLPRIGRQVTVYYNPTDRALLISDKTKANPDRLGSDGPRLVDLLPKKVVLVDCRHVARGADRKAHHGYYVRSVAMERDMRAVMSDRPPDEIANRTFVDRIRSWRLVQEFGEKDVELPTPAEPEGPDIRG
ncbi:alpha/beta fold hydrolase [Roseibacterium beibuensis]|uniref:alpha/beta hydrolase n=1 Tax=[Roseibacterium] beibuensis TaxID=1193142 RepID=UPI00217D1742|nr:alpha/beta fold hydrolase [Roseibacterium beibuensis]MCS6624893.1 alpha/beta fold hydrolase [Roseibacterium beibuensis]